MAMVELEPVPAEESANARFYHHRNDLETHGRVEILTDLTRFDAERLRYLIGQHHRFTGSKRAAEILADWKTWCGKFRKVMPVEYRRALKEMAGRAGSRDASGRVDHVTDMGKITGFLEIEREERDYLPVEERVKTWREFVLPLSEKDTRDQAARCMDCGIPYCHGTGSVAPGTPGCPVNNQIPDWNDLVYKGDWEEAARNLHSTNNFPEVTGRVCPAPCEESCTLNIDNNPVAIKTIECAIADRAIESGWIKPEPASAKTGKKVAVVGSGPAGMACAQQLARAGHDVHVFEKYAQGRRPSALRHSRFQNGKGHCRYPREADGRRRRHLPLRRAYRRQCAGREAAEGL